MTEQWHGGMKNGNICIILHRKGLLCLSILLKMTDSEKWSERN